MEQFDLKIKSITDCLSPSSVTIVAGESGAGKTTLAINVAAQYGICERKRAAIFSLEMSKEQIIQKFLCLLSGVSMSKALSEKLTAEEWQKIIFAHEMLKNSNIITDDSFCANSSDLMQQIEEKISKYNRLDLVIIDNLQFDSHEGLIEEQKLASVLSDIKAIATKFGIPVLVTARLKNDYKIIDFDRLIYVVKGEKALKLRFTGANNAVKIVPFESNFSIGLIKEKN